MSRLRQYYANRYTSSEATNSEFENVIRYLNSAELGNRTLSELLGKVFDSSGNVNIGYEFRFNPSTGIEYRSDLTVDAWTLIVPADSLRGATGVNFGQIGAPLFSNRIDYSATDLQTVFSYIRSDPASNVIVWRNGALQAESDYYVSPTTVVLNTAVTAGTLVSIATINTSPATAFRRADFTASANQATFPFAHTEFEELAVFRNGILQREGGGFDYIKSSATATVTFTTAQTVGNVITIISISNDAIRDVAGLMMEDKYAMNGLIRFDRVAIPDGSIQQTKVVDLAPTLAAKASITVSPASPDSANIGDLWVNTSYSVPAMMFYDGARWLNSSPNGMIPLASPVNANQFIRLNATASGLEYAPFDTTNLVLSSLIGAANGVAPLNSAGQIPTYAIPDFAKKAPITARIPGVLNNITYQIGILDGTVNTISGISARVGSGACTIQLQVGGVNVGSSLACSGTTAKLPISVAAIDASASVKDVSVVVTGNSSAYDLVVNVNNAITG